MSYKEEFDERGNLIYRKYYSGSEWWKEYDKNNNLIHCKDSTGEWWKEYNENNKQIHYKDTYGDEFWYKYDESNKEIKITEQEFKQIERTKERRELLLNNKKINRFSLMDI